MNSRGAGTGRGGGRRPAETRQAGGETGSSRPGHGAGPSIRHAVAEARRRVHLDKKLRDLSITVVYWLLFVGVLALAIVATIFIVSLLFRLRVLKVPGTVLLLGTFTVILVITGTLLSQIVVRAITRPILEMSDAAQRMAKGDFDIELTEKTIAVEVSQMAESFTTMAQELSQIEMLRSDFVSNVSHEMKTPVATINGYATLLEQPGLSDEQRVGYARKILRAAGRLSSLTDNALMLSHLENGQAQIDRAPFSLDEQLREAILMFGAQWEDGERELEIDLADVTYRGNEELLAHVWQNLVGNAIKFTGPGDTITVRCWEETGAAGGAKAAGGAAAPHVVVQVADTGIGMDADACERVFEKFYQADRSHATEGSGLGLALAKRIVELHGGTIGVQSAPAAGSTFTVVLPT